MNSGTWIALGVAIGVAIGAIWDSIGIPVGIALGAGMGGAMYAYASDAESKRRGREKEPSRDKGAGIRSEEDPREIDELRISNQREGISSPHPEP